MGQERIRDRYTATPIGPWAIADSNGFNWSSSESGYPSTQTSLIHDVKEKFTSTRRYAWHPVSTVVVNQVRNGTLPNYTYYPPWWDPFGPVNVVMYSGEFFPVTFVPSGFYNGNLSSHNGLAPQAFASSSVRAHLDNIFQQVPMQVSLANFLWELKDGLAALLPRVSSFLTAVPSIHLWWNFGWLPFVDDFKKLLKVFENTVKRLNHLNNVNRTWTKVRTTTVYAPPTASGPPSAPEEWYPYHTSGAFSGGPVTIQWDVVKLRQQSAVYYDLDLSGADAFLQGVVAALGFNNPAQIVWEAIPFSFVIDWFVDVQEWLEANVDVHQPFSGSIQAGGSTTSYERKTSYLGWVPIDNRGNLDTWHSTLVRQKHRRPGLPSETFDVSGLTTHQQQLAASLLAQGLGGFFHRR